MGHSERFHEAVQGLGQKELAIIDGYFLYNLGRYRRRLKMFIVSRIILTNIVTIGSVLVTAFMTMSHLEWLSPDGKTAFFWVSWILSLIVVIAAKLLSTFDVHKKCVVYTNIVRSYEMEGWRFAAEHYQGDASNQSSRVRLLCDRINKIESSAGRNINSSAGSTENRSPNVISAANFSSPSEP